MARALALGVLGFAASHRVALERRQLTAEALAAAHHGRRVGQPGGATPLFNWRNAEYVANVSVGTPSATFRMVLDTASGNTWLASPACNDFVASPACMFQRKYNASQSRSARPCSGVFCTLLMPLTDANQTLVGTLGNDTLSFVGTALTVPDAVIGSMSLEPLPALDGQAFDGVAGFAFQAAALPLLNKPPMLADQLVAAGAMEPLFSLYLDPAQAPGAAGRSAFLLGEADPATYAAGPGVTLAPFPIWQPALGLWVVTMDYVFAGGILTTGCDHCIAMIDSSSPYIAGPPSAMAQVLALIPPVAPDCSNLASLPNVTLQFGGQPFPLTPADYVLQLPQSYYNSTLVCSSALIEFDASGGTLPLWVVGTPFLRTAYAVFNMSSREVELAPAKAL